MKIYTILFSLILFFSANSIFAQGTETDFPKPEKKYAKYIDARYEFGAMLGTDAEWSDQIVNSSLYQGLDFRLGFR